MGARNPDGSPLYLFACDEHEQMLTADMRRAGTKYSLFPVIGPPTVSPPCECSAEETYERELKKMPVGLQHLVNAATIGVMVVIAPPLLLYYGGKWLMGWRPGEDS